MDTKKAHLSDRPGCAAQPVRFRPEICRPDFAFGAERYSGDLSAHCARPSKITVPLGAGIIIFDRQQRLEFSGLLP
jgi:hypothetical protein